MHFHTEHCIINTKFRSLCHAYTWTGSVIPSVPSYTTLTLHLISPTQIAVITGAGITKTHFLIKKRRFANIVKSPHYLFPALICQEQEPQ